MIPPASNFQDLQAFAAIVFSAVTYLLDFSSNIATAHEYYHMVDVRPSWIGIFIGMLTVMAIAHITNAVIFKLELKKEDQPLKTAYFFPLMQLSRLVQVLWRTCSCKGLGNLKTDDQNSLYNILSVSLETGPQLTLQFVVFMLYYRKTSGRPPKTLTISILASFLSGSVNGGLAVLGVSYAKTRGMLPSWRVKVVGFIISVLMLWGWNNGYPIAAYITMELSFYFILFMILLRRREGPSALTAYCNGKRFLHCVALSYLSAKIGPLQPLTSDARVKDELGKAVYWYRLLLVSAAHLCLYAGVFLLCLAGSPHLRWSNLCPKRLSILPPDEVMGFPCRWYVPATTLGMLMYSLTIASHIAMDNYVDKEAAKNVCLGIYPAPTRKEAGEAELGGAYQIDDNNTSMHTDSHIIESKEAGPAELRGTAQIDDIKESHTMDKAHKVYIDDDDGNEEEERQAELRGTAQINDFKESHTMDKGHKVYIDDDDGDDEGGAENGCVCICPVLSANPEAGEGELEGAAQINDINPSMHNTESHTIDNAAQINPSMHPESHTIDNAAQINPSMHPESHTKDNTESRTIDNAAQINPSMHPESHTKDNGHKGYNVDNIATMNQNCWVQIKADDSATVSHNYVNQGLKRV